MATCVLSRPGEVMDVILSEGPIGVREAARLLPGPDRVSYRTVYRWIRDGVKTDRGQAKLEHIKLGGRIYTSKGAIHRFLTEINESSISMSE